MGCLTRGPLTRGFAARLIGGNYPLGGTTLRIRFSQSAALGISLAAALVPGVFAIAQNTEATERAGPFSGSQDRQAPPLQKPVSDGAEQKLAGTWRGDSLCVEKGTACHDEVAVYRIAAIAGKPDYLMVSGGKVVDGKEIVMGTGEWGHHA
jgi:hypothetical protein